jgi:hypothetical protein
MSVAQSDALVAVLRVGAALESLGVTYAVGGSFASSVQGVFRTTNDVDLVASLREEHVDRFVALLGDDFYADPEMIRDAIRRRSEFNLIFQPAIFKVDVFVPRLDLVARRELSRAEVFEFGDRSLRVISAEDVIAQKLHWFRLGGHVAQRQWEDALGVVKTRRGRLDLEYLRETADALGVLDLLERLLGS